MGKSFTKITSADELNKVFAKSENEPVILFKHSNACPISTYAYRQMEGIAHEVYLIVIQEARPLSAQVEAQTGIRHESPQALILRAGKVAWHATHYDITAQDVAAAVESNR